MGEGGHNVLSKRWNLDGVIFPAPFLSNELGTGQYSQQVPYTGYPEKFMLEILIVS
jgi:hypothetical protein